MQDLRQTPQYANYMKSLGWQVAKCKVATPNPQMFLKKVPVVGIIVKLQRPAGHVNFDEISHLIDKYNISAFYIEQSIQDSSYIEQSIQDSYPNTFKTAKSAFLPAKTLQINLTKTEEQLLKDMKPKTRYNIKIAKKREVIVKHSADIGNFINLWKKQATRRLALPQSKEINALWNAFGKKATLFMAYQGKELLAGLLIASSADTAFYMYAGSNKEGKKLFAPTLLTWEAIRTAKNMGLKTFDFEGVFDERYSSTKPWKGFTKFKEGFGGKVVEYPRTLVYYKNPLFRVLL